MITKNKIPQTDWNSKNNNGDLLVIYLKKCKKAQTPRSVVVKAMDCRIVVSEFVLQLRYYVHFRANTLGKGMNPLILPAMG